MRVVLLFFTILFSTKAEAIRVGMWNSDFSRDGPGLFISELILGDTYWDNWGAQIRALELDYLLLVDVDQDYEGWAAELLSKRAGFDYYDLGPSNRGVPTGFDLNNDGYLNALDSHGFGDFVGQHGMVILSRNGAKSLRSFNQLLLKDFSEMPMLEGRPFYQEAAWDVLRLSPTGLWDFDFGDFHLLASYANVPAFDGPEESNVLRNAAELRWWTRYMSGERFLDDAGEEAGLDGAFILAGTLNLDPERGAGRREVLRELLASPRLRPFDFPTRDTADWSAQGLGTMRVDYILPSCEFEAGASGVVDMQSAHKLLWVDLVQGGGC